MESGIAKKIKPLKDFAANFIQHKPQFKAIEQMELSGRLAQRQSTTLTRQESLVRFQYRPFKVKKLKHNHPINIVIGLGISGIAAARYLKEKDGNVLVFEKSTQPSVQQLATKIRKEGINVHLGTSLEYSNFEPWLNKLSSVITLSLIHI